MPDVVIQKDASIDLLDTKEPKKSATSDAPVVETKPDASPAPDEGKTPAESEPQEQPAETAASDKPKKPAQGVQKRLDELTRQREDERRARLRSEQLLADAIAALKNATTAKAATPDAATEDDPEPIEPNAEKYTDQAKFNADYRQYLREAAKWEGRHEAKRYQSQQREQEQKRTREDAHRKMVETYQANAAKAREKYPDYDSVVGNESLPITVHMRDAIAQTAEGPDIAYHLGTNLEEATRIAQLSPHGQLIELGLIAAQYRVNGKAAAAAPASRALPPPIKPLGTASAAAPSQTGGEPTMEAYAAKRLPALQAERRPGGKR